MLESVLFLQSFYYSGGGQFGTFLDSLAEMGFFSYVLPFLLLFALVYGLLLKVKMFEKNNAINGIIAMAVALLALQFEIVPQFFAEIFPRLGIGLAIILVLLILIGLFLPKATWMGYLLLGASIIIFLVILYQSGGGYGSDFFYWIGDYWPLLVGLGFILAVIAIMFGKKSEKAKTPAEKIFTNLFGSE